MNPLKLIRFAALCLILSLTAVATFADPPAPQPCTCEYCSRTSPQRSCILDGTATTCGYFLAVALCPAG